MSEAITVRRILSDAPERMELLRLATSEARRRSNRAMDDPVRQLVASAERGRVSLDLLFGVFRGEDPIAAALAAESAGKAALVFIPQDLEDPHAIDGATRALGELMKAAWEHGLKLLESLTEPGARKPAHVLKKCGFRYLTRLLYLRQTVGKIEENQASHANVSWITYSPENQSTFERALRGTYVQSLDCPEVTALREPAEVLAGHRAVGDFSPDLWFVASRGGEPAGVLLLAPVLETSVMEVVYMGVSPSARGQGVADALMARAVASARRYSVKTLALAVDCRNAPARRVYERWRFRLITSRDAWIASPPGTIV